MKKALLGSVLALTVASFGASAADMISKDEAHHFKLEYLGNVSVGASGGQISSRSDLHQHKNPLLAGFLLTDSQKNAPDAGRV